ncbi:MAG TPA: nickel insertion protein, partial [Limnochordia bacterium]|nr:nickel insertion protein [Limnochordia bacterium]
MRIVFLDCSAGIAGDMLLGALIDLGADVEAVRRGLAGLRLEEPWRLEVEPAVRRGIAGLRARVEVDGSPADAAFVAGGLEAGGAQPHGYGHGHGHESREHRPAEPGSSTHHHEGPAHGHPSP